MRDIPIVWVVCVMYGNRPGYQPLTNQQLTNTPSKSMKQNLLEKAIVPKLVTDFSTVYGTQSYIAVFLITMHGNINVKLHCRIHNSPPVVPVLSQINPAHFHNFHSCTVHLDTVKFII